MITSILIDILCGLLSSIVFNWAFSWYSRQRLYSLECDVADLQDRHLRTVRKAAADKRWQGEEDFDAKLEAVLEKSTPEKKGWTKWASSRNSNSEKSSVEPLEGS